MKTITKSEVNENGQVEIGGMTFDVTPDMNLVPIIENPKAVSMPVASDKVKGIEALTHGEHSTWVNAGKSKTTYFSKLTLGEAYVALTSGLVYSDVVTSATVGKHSTMVYRAQVLSEATIEAISKVQGGKDHATKKADLKSTLSTLLDGLFYTNGKGKKVKALDYLYDRISQINGTELQCKAVDHLDEGQTSSMAVRSRDGAITGGSAHWKTIS